MFGTSGIRGPVGEEVTADLALRVGRALAADADRVVIGRDPRSSGEFLSDALSAGVRECGGDVVDIGLAATPTIARGVSWCDADAGVAITASHNPPPDNGIKLWQPSGQAFDAARRDGIERRLASGHADPAPWDTVGDGSTWGGARERHVAAITATLPGSELPVAVDVGTGAGGLTVDALLDLGCDVTALNAQPDGRFPARPSEPTAENCQILRAVVRDGDAAIGIAHDGDADRMLAVDGTGDWVPGDVLLAVLARATADRGDVVAVPVDTSLAVDDALAEVGATAIRTPVGDVHVADAAAEPDVVFGGEPSGAWIWPEETLCPDGPYAAARLVSIVEREGPLAELAAGIDTYPIRRGSVETDERDAVMTRVREEVEDRFADIDHLDGVRVDLDDAWFLVRASGTEPLVRVTAESRDPDRADAVFERARSLVEGAARRG